MKLSAVRWSERVSVSDSGHHQLPPASGHGPAADIKHPELRAALDLLINALCH